MNWIDATKEMPKLLYHNKSTKIDIKGYLKVNRHVKYSEQKGYVRQLSKDPKDVCFDTVENFNVTHWCYIN